MDDEPVTLKTLFQLCLVAAVANLTLLAATLPVAGRNSVQAIQRVVDVPRALLGVLAQHNIRWHACFLADASRNTPPVYDAPMATLHRRSGRTGYVSDGGDDM